MRQSQSAGCGDRNHYANVEAGFCRGINGSEYEDRFARQGQSHTSSPTMSATTQ
jgi:hypothetical protein